MADFWDESTSFWGNQEEEATPTAAVEQVEQVDEDQQWLDSLQTAFVDDEDDYKELRNDPYLSEWIPPLPAKPIASLPAEGSFSGIFRNEGARTGQPTNLKSSAVGRGQMIKGTREAMYKKLGFTDVQNAEQRFRTDPDFEMKVMNAYRDELDKRIPSNVQGKQREYMIAKGWYTGDPFYDDNKVPGRSAGNRLTAGEYASRAVKMQYGGVDNIPEDLLQDVSLDSIQEYVDLETSPFDQSYYPQPKEEEIEQPSGFSKALYAGLNGVNKFKQVKNKLDSIGAGAARSVSEAIDIQTEIAGAQRNASTMRKFNANKNLKKYSINKTPLNQPLIYT